MILDTNAVSALLAGDDELGRILSNAQRHHLPLPVIAEYQARQDSLDIVSRDPHFDHVAGLRRIGW